MAKANIFLTCTEEKYYSNELIVQKNTLIRIVSGEMRIILPDTTYILQKGDTIFFPRHEVAKVIKAPKDGKPYTSVAIYFTPDAIQQYHSRHETRPVAQFVKTGIRVMEPHPLLESLFSSLIPYFQLKNELPLSIAEAKVDEAINIFQLIDEDLFNSINHFDEPHKINLTDFMEKHYMFNMTMEKFGYLTGRSLTTFKRDFKKAYNTTPQRWLTQKRLELAHSQLAEQKRKPVDVYLEVGFENLSHFSYAFRKQYGYAPGAVASQT